MVAGAQLFAVAQGDQFRIRYRVRRFCLAVPRRFLRIGHESAVLVLLDHVGRVADRMHVVVSPGGNACQFGFVSRSVILGRKPLALDLIDFLADLPGHGRCEIRIIAERPGKFLKRVESLRGTADYFGDLLVCVDFGRFQRCAFRTFAHDTLLGNSRIGVGVGRLKRGLVAGGNPAVQPLILCLQFFDIRVKCVDVLLVRLGPARGNFHLLLQLLCLGRIVFAIELFRKSLDRRNRYLVFLLVEKAVDPVRELRFGGIFSALEPRF